MKNFAYQLDPSTIALLQKIFGTGICFPLCKESEWINFKDSGDKKDDFICNKCYSFKNSDLFFECKICNGKFCSLCPKSNYENFPLHILVVVHKLEKILKFKISKMDMI